MGASLQSFARSKDPAQRQIYDYTYGFIKGTLKLKPDKLADMKLKCGANKSVSGKVSGPEDSLYKVTQYPSHGTLTLESDGSFTYYPNKGYTGKDTFAVARSEWLDYSDPGVVTVEIK